MVQPMVNTSRIVDYFTKAGLQKMIGEDESWDFVMMKELIDNALDAVETLPEKMVCVEYNSSDKMLSVFDNGAGIKQEDLENKIYKFDDYGSSKRHYVTPSRGKQGNGLKTVICMCHLMGYSLLWHTAEGKILQFQLDDLGKEYGEIEKECHVIGATENKGVTVYGMNGADVHLIVWEYSLCNPDVNIVFLYDDREIIYDARANAIDRSGDSDVSFYDLETFRNLLRDHRDQDGEMSYRQFLVENFSDSIANKKTINGRTKLKNIDTKSDTFTAEFNHLRSIQNKNKYTILKNHLIGLDYDFHGDDTKTGFPYYVEFSIEKNEGQKDNNSLCFINNSITYDSIRIKYSSGYRQIGNKTGRKNPTTGKYYDLYSYNIDQLVEQDTEYFFIIHFISPQFSFMNFGKSEVDISGIIDRLCEELKKRLTTIRNRDKKTDTAPKNPRKRTLMRRYLTEAYQVASSGGKYATTARQIFYKLRELAGFEEGKSTYNDFTQKVLTEWIDNNPEAAERVYFSERGNYFIGDMQAGLGTASVNVTINNDDDAKNIFTLYGGWTNGGLLLKRDFNLRYQYSRVLYIEKTGFDGVFKAEQIGKKYHMIIVSGQGFITRAGKTLLHYFQQQGLKLYCMHDFDYSGVNIINSIREPNEKFSDPIEIEDIGITLDDIRHYGIKPEPVKIKKKDYDKIDKSRYTPEQRRFFFRGDHVQRVELNAFTTAQILEIIDKKLGTVDSLPCVRLSDVVRIDARKVKEAALMNALKKKYAYVADLLPDPDLQAYDSVMDVYQIEARAQDILDNMLTDMEVIAEEKLKKIQM